LQIQQTIKRPIEKWHGFLKWCGSGKEEAAKKQKIEKKTPGHSFPPR
jgi:hypothetical protein